MKITGKLKFAYDSIVNLEQKISKLEHENDKLKSHCEFLSGELQHFLDRVNEGSIRSVKTASRFSNALEKTPQQNLSEIKAQAIEEVVEECMSLSDDGMVKAKAVQMMYYAKKIRAEK